MYREPPPTPPLVVTTDHLAQAFDSRTGRLLWSRAIVPDGGYARVAASGTIFVVAVGSKVLVIEVATGRTLLETKLWFSVHAAVAHDGLVALTGEGGLACFDETGYVWGVRPDGEGFRVENARGEETARLDAFAAASGGRSDLGMALGTSVFQPDRDT
ncbi:MAG: PQQ-binding-like beta-propeller repeat protein [Myxococcales bacterium]|nr:PQQ-binding-like beta-propeller repeat protein [Myxococcales bacterium]